MEEAVAVEPIPAEELIDIEYFSKVKLRVARIEAVEPVPKSKKLYRIQLDLGDHKRQIVSGIALAYTPEELIGKSIVIIANLKPATIMGVESRGMLLAASPADDSVISILMPCKDVPPGAKVR